MTKLKQCPFCGGKAEVDEMVCKSDGQISCNSIHARCQNCGSTGPNYTTYYDASSNTKEEAIAAWNRRAEQGSETLVRCGECIKPLTECPFKEYVMLKTDYCSYGAKLNDK